MALREEKGLGPQDSEELITTRLRRNTSSAITTVLEHGCRLFDSYCRGSYWCRELLKLLKLVEPSDSVHGIGHTLRVSCLAFYIAEAEYSGVYEPCIVAAASLIHDVGRVVENTHLHHALASSNVSGYLCRAVNCPCRVEVVARTVLEHSYSLGLSPSSIESCIVSDADKIDALGYIGFYRLAYVSGSKRRGLEETLQHYHSKLSRLPDNMCTATGRRLAQILVEEMKPLINTLAKVYSLETRLAQL